MISISMTREMRKRNSFLVGTKKILLTLGSDSNCKELFIVGALGTVAQTQKEGISYWSKMTLEQKPAF